MDTLLLEETEKQLDTKIGELARSRQKEKADKEVVDYWNAELETYLAEFPNTEQLEKAKEVFADQVANTNGIDTAVRGKTLELYGLQGHKNVYGGVSVAEYATFEIDENLAIAWASEHHQKALKLNTTEIKKVAKAGMEVHGVVLGTENRVKIASDLSTYLSDEQ